MVLKYVCCDRCRKQGMWCFPQISCSELAWLCMHVWTKGKASDCSAILRTRRRCVINQLLRLLKKTPLEMKQVWLQPVSWVICNLMHSSAWVHQVERLYDSVGGTMCKCSSPSTLSDWLSVVSGSMSYLIFSFFVNSRYARCQAGSKVLSPVCVQCCVCVCCYVCFCGVLVCVG